MFNAIKAGAMQLINVIKGAGLSLVGFITSASFATIAKFGLLAGLAIGVIFLVVKFIKDKFVQFKNSKAETPVERAVELNYADHKNIKKLNRDGVMRDVRKALIKRSKKRNAINKNQLKTLRKMLEKKYGKANTDKYDNLLQFIELEENELQEQSDLAMMLGPDIYEIIDDQEDDESYFRRPSHYDDGSDYEGYDDPTTDMTIYDRISGYMRHNRVNDLYHDWNDHYKEYIANDPRARFKKNKQNLVALFHGLFDKKVRDPYYWREDDETAMRCYHLLNNPYYEMGTLY